MSWAEDAANEIHCESVDWFDGSISLKVLVGIIEKHRPRCETCQHWDHENITSQVTAECMLETMSAVINVGNIEERNVQTIRFQMRTKADFGCVQWEEK